MANGHGGRRPGAGRPKGSRPALLPKVSKTATEIARQLLPELVPILREIAADRDAPAAARVSAVNVLWDRAEGKPRQTLEHTGKDGGPIVHHMTADDRELLGEAHDGLAGVSLAAMNGANGSQPH